MKMASEKNKEKLVEKETKVEEILHGEWMVVTRRKKSNLKKDSNVRKGRDT